MGVNGRRAAPSPFLLLGLYTRAGATLPDPPRAGRTAAFRSVRSALSTVDEVRNPLSDGWTRGKGKNRLFFRKAWAYGPPQMKSVNTDVAYEHIRKRYSMANTCRGGP
jgi:hypothetical protein